jgi:hypothetical protein
MPIHIYTYTCIPTHIYTNTYVHMYPHTDMHTCLHTYIHIYTHAHVLMPTVSYAQFVLAARRNYYCVKLSKQTYIAINLHP